MAKRVVTQWPVAVVWVLFGLAFFSQVPADTGASNTASDYTITANENILLQVDHDASPGTPSDGVGAVQITGSASQDATSIILDVTGATRLNGEVVIDSAGGGGNTLTVNAAGTAVTGGLASDTATVSGTATLNGATTVNDTFSVNDGGGNTLTVNAGGTSVVGGFTGDTAIISGTATLNGATTVNDTLSVNDGAGHTLAVNGSGTTVVGGFTGDTATVSGTTTLNGATAVNDTLSVNDGAGHALAVNGSGTTVGGGLISDTVSVTGTATLGGATSVNNTLGVTSSGNTFTATNSTNGHVLAVSDSGSSMTSGSNSLSVGAAGTAVSGNMAVSSGTNALSVNAATGTTVTGVLSTTGLATLNAAAVTNNATVGGSLTVDGVTTVNNTLAVDSNGATAGGNTLTVDGTAVSMASGANSLTVDSTTGTTIDGNLVVNGTITGFSPTTSSGITNGNSSLQVGGTGNDVVIIADDNSIEADGRGQISVAKDQISIGVTNSDGNNHGLVVTETEAVLTGGSTSTSLTLNDGGATFSNTDTGGPARVTGVADGVGKYDAVNVSQLKSAYGGIASVAALAAIPEALPGKRHSVGMGVGYYEGQKALAIGYKSRLNERMSFSTGFGRSRGNTSANVGVGFSW
ncbi:MAG: YadA-like family protein [Candidatus Sedimenticola sp. 6PFRAG5]